MIGKVFSQSQGIGLNRLAFLSAVFQLDNADPPSQLSQNPRFLTRQYHSVMTTRGAAPGQLTHRKRPLKTRVINSRFAELFRQSCRSLLKNRAFGVAPMEFRAQERNRNTTCTTVNRATT
jgi:hypothetical protein